MAGVNSDFERVAVITVNASAVKTTERRLNHLRRRASLLGCDGLINVEHFSEDESRGTCVRRREPVFAQAETPMRVVATPAQLRAKARAGGAAGIALLRVLDQADRRSGDERAWPLKWYLERYPNSPFHADVEAMFVAVETGSGGSTASVRNAQSK